MTAQMVPDALIIAIWRRRRPKELLHHSDQGSQYTSEPFQRLMADNGVVCSMSRSGNVWDNAAAESFFLSLKIERVKRKVYRTRDRADVFDYIERYYNPTRRHSTIGYLSPVTFEERAMKVQVAVHETGSNSKPVNSWCDQLAGLAGETASKLASRKPTYRTLVKEEGYRQALILIDLLFAQEQLESELQELRKSDEKG